MTRVSHRTLLSRRRGWLLVAVGATALLTQVAALYAERERARGRTACLFDLDLQGGNAATHLGLGSALTVSDLLDAGKRLDPAVLLSVATGHESGLQLFAAPTDLMRSEEHTSELSHRT